MPDLTEVTAFLPGLQAADEAAGQKVWEQFYDRLIRLAHRNLSQLSRREADEEDVVLSAMHSFMRGAAEGRFPQLNDRNDLWKLLVTCTLRKVSKQRKRQRAAKRGRWRTASLVRVVDAPGSPAIRISQSESSGG